MRFRLRTLLSDWKIAVALLSTLVPVYVLSIGPAQVFHEYGLIPDRPVRVFYYPVRRLTSAVQVLSDLQTAYLDCWRKACFSPSTYDWLGRLTLDLAPPASGIRLVPSDAFPMDGGGIQQIQVSADSAAAAEPSPREPQGLFCTPDITGTPVRRYEVKLMPWYAPVIEQREDERGK